MPSSYAKILAKNNYGDDFKFNDNGPYELLLSFLMQQKAKKIISIKQELISCQLKLLQLINLLKTCSLTPEKEKALYSQFQKYKKKVKLLVSHVNQLESSFNNYSSNLIEQAMYELPRDLNDLIDNVEKITGNKLTDDIRSLFFKKNGLPISGQKLKQIMIERGIKND